MPVSPERRILANLVKHAQSEEEDPLTPLIDDYLLKREKPAYRHLRIAKYEIDTLDRPRPPGRISPSNAGGCAKAAVFTFLGTQGRKRTDPDQEAIFEDGKWRHHKWGFMFLEMERFFPKKFRVISIEENVSIKGLRIAGSLDATIEIKVKGVWLRYVVDFKGANSYAYEDTYRTKKPNPRYVWQVITYIKARNEERGMLLFESKDKNRYFVFPIKMTDRKWAEVKLWTEGVLDHLERKKLPPRDPDCKNGLFLYNRCPFRDKCFGKLGDKQVQREVFIDFPGVKQQWKLGKKMIAEYEDAKAG